MTAQKQIDLLMSFAKVVSRIEDLDALLNTMAEYAKELVDADRCSIFLYDAKEDELWTTVAQETDMPIRIPADSGVAGYAALSKEIQIVVDAYNDFRFNPEVDQSTGYTTRTILTVPLLGHNDEVLGVFQALNKQNGLFTREDAEILLLISNYASQSIENALLSEKLNETQTQIILKLSSAAEFKDNDTSLHTKRVGLYSRLIAEKLGFSKKEADLLELTAPMHDAGKIGIADAIIHKPGKLSETEFNEMKRHAEIGYKLLYDEDNELLRTAAIIARDHHEKVDGSGYPQGLIGDEISLFGRIVAIADVFDALTTERPYKEPWSIKEAIKYLQDHRASHFDSSLVDIFVEDISEIKQIYNNFHD